MSAPSIVPAPAPPTSRPLAAPVSAASDTVERGPAADAAKAAMRATRAIARSPRAPHPIAPDPRTRRPRATRLHPADISRPKLARMGHARRYYPVENDAFSKTRRLVLSRHT